MKVRINDKEYSADVEDFTLGEAREIKRLSGFTLGNFGEALNDSDPDAITALVWVCVRRENPSITLEEILAQNIGTLMVDEAEADVVPPSKAAKEGVPASK